MGCGQSQSASVASPRKKVKNLDSAKETQQQTNPSPLTVPASKANGDPSAARDGGDGKSTQSSSSKYEVADGDRCHSNGNSSDLDQTNEEHQEGESSPRRVVFAADCASSPSHCASPSRDSLSGPDKTVSNLSSSGMSSSLVTPCSPASNDFLPFYEPDNYRNLSPLDDIDAPSSKDATDKRKRYCLLLPVDILEDLARGDDVEDPNEIEKQMQRVASVRSWGQRQSLTRALSPRHGGGPQLSPRKRVSIMVDKTASGARIAVAPACDDRSSDGSRNSPNGSPVVVSRTLIRSFDDMGNKTLNEYAVLGKLGSGSFSKVKIGVSLRTEQPVAIKILNRTKLGRTFMHMARSKEETPEHSQGSLPDVAQPMSTALAYVKQEIEIMTKMRHPNLVRLHAVIDDEESEKLYMVLEYMSGGTLCCTPMLENNTESDDESLPEASVDCALIKHQFLDILHGLDYLHRRNVIHMDIKPENVLLDEEGNCKLADFGVCSVLEANFERDEDVVRSTHGTPIYFAPEMVSGKPFHGKAADVWALGVTLYVSVYGRLPFRGSTLQEISESIVNDAIAVPECQGMSTALRDVLQRMLCKEPSLRITVVQLLGHPFFSDRVPLEWSVRVWKESKLTSCESAHDMMELVTGRNVQLKDNTDRSGERKVSVYVLERSMISPKSSAPHLK